MRKNSFAIAGGAFGDEGKGKVVDFLASSLVEKYKEIAAYRYNGGANAGHTVIFKGDKIILHHVPSGALIPKSLSILGKGMVLHPADLVYEIKCIQNFSKGTLPGKIIIDEMATLTLDTHRAYETTLKKWQTGSAGSTGRGIAPAYADILLRHPVRVRDLAAKNWKRALSEHFDLYRAHTKGLGEKIERTRVVSLAGKPTMVGETVVGTKKEFLQKLAKARRALLPFIKDSLPTLEQLWARTETPFIFEGAQGIGLDPRWGVYPDVTASDVAFSGIHSSTEGVVNPKDINVRALTYKATYTSSLGVRKLPTVMDEDLAKRIREDAAEFGATTGRPRDIFHLDIPSLSFFSKVSGATHFILTHLDIAYPEEPIKVCLLYQKDGKEVSYRPDQEFLSKVKPVYMSLPAWNGAEIKNSTNTRLPRELKRFLLFFSWALDIVPFMGTTGPERNSVIALASI